MERSKAAITKAEHTLEHKNDIEEKFEEFKEEFDHLMNNCLKNFDTQRMHITGIGSSAPPPVPVDELQEIYGLP